MDFERFVNKSIDPHTNKLTQGQNIVDWANHNDGNVSGLGLDAKPLTNQVTIGPRGVDIKENEIRVFCLGCCHCTLTIHGEQGTVARLNQNVVHDTQTV